MKPADPKYGDGEFQISMDDNASVAPVPDDGTIPPLRLNVIPCAGHLRLRGAGVEGVNSGAAWMLRGPPFAEGHDHMLMDKSVCIHCRFCLIKILTSGKIPVTFCCKKTPNNPTTNTQRGTGHDTPNFWSLRVRKGSKLPHAPAVLRNLKNSWHEPPWAANVAWRF